MPLYVYECEEHGKFTKIRKIVERNEPLECKICGKECPHTPDFTTGPPVFKGSGFHSTDYNTKEGSR